MTGSRSTAQTALSGIVVTYIVLTVLMLGASYLIPRPEARGILRSVFGLLLFPSLLVLPILLLLRRWRLALLTLPLVGVWLIVYGRLLVPRGGSAPAEAARLTVLTFNVQTATEGLDSLSQLIAEVDADIVAVQELSAPASEHLRTTLADRYPHMTLHPGENPHWGQGILSRFSITAHEYWRNEQIEVAQGHLWADLDVDGRTVTVFSTHPVPPFSFDKGLTLQAHSQEIAILLERAAQRTTPLILAGDFNLTGWMDEYQQLTAAYTDAFRAAGAPGLGFTFPAGNRLPLPPVVRLDYIFHSPHFVSLNAYPLLRSTVSDHLAFYAALALLPAEPA